MSSPAPFDTSPLVDPIDPAAFRAARSQISDGLVLGPVIAVVVAFFLGIVVLPGVLSVSDTGAERTSVLVLFGIGILAVIGISIAVALAGLRRRYRVWKLAQANGMTYVQKISDPGYPGLLFDEGRSRHSFDVLQGVRGREVEYASYRYTVGSGKNSTTYTWHYGSVRLRIPLPNIVLDATSNNMLGSNLPDSFDKGQRLSLEGDFDKYFTLYCPSGYEADALYLFSPDVMADMIDTASDFDVEIIDDRMYFYRNFTGLGTDPASWREIVTVTDTLQKRLDQWERWRDDRLAEAATPDPSAPVPAPGAPASPDAPVAAAPGAPMVPAAPTPVAGRMPFRPVGVAEPGRRLQSGINGGVIVAAGVIIVVLILFTTVLGR